MAPADGPIKWLMGEPSGMPKLWPKFFGHAQARKAPA